MNKMNFTKICVALMLTLVSACGKPVQKFELRITDETGNPLQGVTGKAWFNIVKEGSTSMDSYLLTNATDKNGKVELEGETLQYRTACGAEEEGYYPASKGDLWIKGQRGNRWEPWPVEVDLTLKKIINPVPMYAVNSGNGIGALMPDAENKSFGYDLLARDWVAPWGKGTTADFVFFGMEEFGTDPGQPMTGKLKIGFSNAGDGIIAMPIGSDGGSELLGPHKAPEGNYASEHAFMAKPAEKLGVPSQELANLVWVFRIRTVKDDQGRIVSSRYGKIYGYPQILSMRGRPAIRFNYYVSGIDNDRNLEWDMKTNLFKDLNKESWPERP